MKVLVFALVLGASQALHQERVIGGQEANILEFPFQVSFQHWVSDKFQEHICAGSIIHERWIMTAGHCLSQYPDWPKRHFVIRAGITSLSEEGGQEVKVDKILLHDGFTGAVAPHDIALLHLESDLEFNEKVQKARLPLPDEHPVGDAVVSGWGTTENLPQPIPSDGLRKATVNLLTYQECAAAFTAAIGGISGLHENNVCAGPLTGGVSACSYDSGGPLSQNGTVIGIVSWGLIPCALPGVPQVYTMVSAYLPFVYEHVDLS